MKVLGEEGTRELVGMCKEMYDVGVWPEDFTRVIMIPLQKKPNAEDCEDHRANKSDITCFQNHVENTNKED